MSDPSPDPATNPMAWLDEHIEANRKIPKDAPDMIAVRISSDQAGHGGRVEFGLNLTADMSDAQVDTLFEMARGFVHNMRRGKRLLTVEREARLDQQQRETLFHEGVLPSDAQEAQKTL